MKTVQKIIDKVVDCEKRICVVFLVVMMLINFAQVLLRYVFSKPFNWSEEIILLVLVWFGFICMSIDIRQDSHAAITGVYNKFPPFLKKIADIIRHGLLSVFFALMINYGFQLFELAMRKKLPASQLSQGWQYAPVILGGCLMFFFSVINLLSVFMDKDTYKKEVK